MPSAIPVRKFFASSGVGVPGVSGTVHVGTSGVRSLEQPCPGKLPTALERPCLHRPGWLLPSPWLLSTWPVARATGTAVRTATGTRRPHPVLASPVGVRFEMSCKGSQAGRAGRQRTALLYRGP